MCSRPLRRTALRRTALRRTALRRTALRRTPLRRTPPPPDRPPPDRPPPDRPSAGPPKISLFFFPSPATIFILFSLSCWSFSLNFGGVFEDRDPQMCTFGLSGCRVKPPAAPPDRAAGARTRQPENSKRAFFERPGASNTTKILRKRPKEREKIIKNCGGRGKKKREILGPHPSGPHPWWPHCGPTIQKLAKLDWPKLDWPKLDWPKLALAKIGRAKTTMAKNGLAKIGLAKIGQIRMAKTGLAKVGPFPADMPEPVRKAFMSATVTALQKPDGGGARHCYRHFIPSSCGQNTGTPIWEGS